jgi:aspartate/glutamate racemase
MTMPATHSPAKRPAPRIALIHALSHSVEPINAFMAEQWPEATRMNLLDDSLSADLARSGRGLDDAMHKRFADLADYALGSGAEAILFTCSAFGPCIEAVAQRYPHIPVLKPNQAMIADAEAGQAAGPVGLIATFGPTLASMPPEFPARVALRCALAEGALDALNRGDVDLHDELIADSARRLIDDGCATIALAQFSMARAHDACVRAAGAPVLTTVHSAVHELKRRLAQQAP